MQQGPVGLGGECLPRTLFLSEHPVHPHSSSRSSPSAGRAAATTGQGCTAIPNPLKASAGDWVSLEENETVFKTVMVTVEYCSVIKRTEALIYTTAQTLKTYQVKTARHKKLYIV